MIQLEYTLKPNMALVPVPGKGLIYSQGKYIYRRENSQEDLGKMVRDMQALHWSIIVKNVKIVPDSWVPALAPKGQAPSSASASTPAMQTFIPVSSKTEKKKNYIVPIVAVIIASIAIFKPKKRKK